MKRLRKTSYWSFGIKCRPASGRVAMILVGSFSEPAADLTGFSTCICTRVKFDYTVSKLAKTGLPSTCRNDRL